ncbi:MAG TPA: ATP-binding protein [Burkholderiales bacterium]|nr:ATP-binding protein [Burkholderiales bacterium]
MTNAIAQRLSRVAPQFSDAPWRGDRIGKGATPAAQPSRLDLIVLDEVGYLPFARWVSQLLFHYVSKRITLSVIQEASPDGRQEGGHVPAVEPLLAGNLDI